MQFGNDAVGRPTAGALRVALAAAFVASCSVSAEPVAPAASPTRQLAAHAQILRPFFGELDCEHLGYVQPGEVDEHVGPIFIGFDVNRSRDIDAQEWQRFPFTRDKPLMTVSFQVADVDGDNVISIFEFTRYMKLAVRALDANGDGEVFPAELEASLPSE